jgi:Protein of unknown function (DUF2778)
MPWTYQQSTGEIRNAEQLTGTDPYVLGSGYSGFGEGKNNPAFQDVPSVGPIPQGRYLIRGAFDSPTHGPVAMPLVPDASNQMFGRSEFLIHGDSLAAPGSASKGCIILPRGVREAINASEDKLLVVVA